MSVALNEKAIIIPIRRYDENKKYLTLARFSFKSNPLTGDGTGGNMVVQCSLPALGSWFSGKQILFTVDELSYLQSNAATYMTLRIYSGEYAGGDILSFSYQLPQPTSLPFHTTCVPQWATAILNCGVGSSIQIDRDNVAGHTILLACAGRLIDEAMIP